MTVSAFGRTRITPYNWSFVADLWGQLAFWAQSLIFLLASILVPKLLFDLRLRDLALLIALIVAVFAARLADAVPRLPDGQSRSGSPNRSATPTSSRSLGEACGTH